MEERVKLPKGIPLPEYTLMVFRLLEGTRFKITDALEKKSGSEIEIQISNRKKLVRKIFLSYDTHHLPGYARAAIVIEGFGTTLSKEVLTLFSAIQSPVSIGIIPGKKFSEKRTS